jgi:MFS family permease
VSSASGAFAPLRIRSFRWLVLGSTIGRLGSGIAPIALAFAVLDVSHSIAALGLVVGARSVANVLLTLFGGVLADRLPRRLLLVGSSTASAGTQFAVAVVIASRLDAIGLLMALAALNGAVDAVGRPLSTAVIPQTLPQPLLQAGNALSRIGFNAAGFLGTAIGGIIVAAFGSAPGIAIDAVSFLLAAGCYAFVSLPPSERIGGTSMFADLAAGWVAFRSRQWLWAVVAAFTVANCAYAGSIGVLGPELADRTFGRAAWGFVLAAFTAGFVVGGFVALRIRPRRPMLVAVLCALPFGLLPLPLALLPSPFALIPIFFVAGIAVEVFEIQWQTALQTQIPTAMLARVVAYDLLGSFVAIPVGQVLAAPLALALGVQTTLVVSAAVAVAALAACLLSPQIRRMRALSEPASSG